MMTREQLLEMGRQDLPALVELTLNLEQEVQKLKGQLAQNSANSSKPPSSDDYQKPSPKSQRRSSRRKTGGQPGHPGRTLQRVEKPDRVQVHAVTHCSCGQDLRTLPLQGYETRQVFDLPKPKLEVTEHRAEIKTCACGCRVRADFPPEVQAPVQYGARVDGLLVYLRDGQLLPGDRVSQLFADLYGYAISPATIEAARHWGGEQLQSFDERLRAILPLLPILHADETGLWVTHKLHWLHVLCTPKFTFYDVHPKRGMEAFSDIGLLPRFTGRLIHDCLESYWNLSCTHGLCNPESFRDCANSNSSRNNFTSRGPRKCKRCFWKCTTFASNTPTNPSRPNHMWIGCCVTKFCSTRAGRPIRPCRHRRNHGEVAASKPNSRISSLGCRNTKPVSWRFLMTRKSPSPTIRLNETSG